MGETVRTRFPPQNMRPNRDYVASPGHAFALTQKTQNPGFLSYIVKQILYNLVTEFCSISSEILKNVDSLIGRSDIGGKI